MAPKKIAKRRPGGGRKPQGRITGNREVLNLRVTSELRSGIERAAKKNNLSLNQEAQERLKLSLDYDRKVPRFRALIRLMEIMAKIIEDKTGQSWIKDPYTAKMLQGAVNSLIMDLGARGDAIVPTAIAEDAGRQRAEGLNPSVDPYELGTGEAQFIIGQIRIRYHSTKVFNSLFDKDLPPKEWRKRSYSKFDELIEDLDL
jgi:hypothetical protein